MIGLIVAIQAVAIFLLGWRLYLTERRLVRSSLVWHEAANRAMRRYRRDRWRWREADGVIRIIARETLPGLDVPDLLVGPPDDPDSGEV